MPEEAMLYRGMISMEAKGTGVFRDFCPDNQSCKRGECGDPELWGGHGPRSESGWHHEYIGWEKLYCSSVVTRLKS
jgi:hypothetical protein